jgi:hypothetical protein
MSTLNVRDITSQEAADLRDQGHEDLSEVVAVDRYEPVSKQWLLVAFAPSRVDADKYLSQHNNDESSRAFFAGRPLVASVSESGEVMQRQLSEATPQQVRHQARRTKVLETMMAELLGRQTPGSAPNILMLTWEEFERLRSEYEDAVAHNEGNRSDFQPLSAYHHKILQLNEDGTVKRRLRTPFANEVGVLTFRDGSSKICLLKDQGPGDIGGKYHQVPGTPPAGGEPTKE